MKWGAAYRPKDVNVLYGMEARNITGEFKVDWSTDNASDIRPAVTCLPLPPLGGEIPPDMPGCWTEYSEARTPRDHLRWVWTQLRAGNKWKGHISLYLQRVDWIAKYWKE